MDRTIHWNPREPKNPFPMKAVLGGVVLIAMLAVLVLGISSVFPSKKEVAEREATRAVLQKRDVNALSDHIRLVMKGSVNDETFWLFQDREGNEYFKFRYDGNLIQINQKKVDLPGKN